MGTWKIHIPYGLTTYVTLRRNLMIAFDYYIALAVAVAAAILVTDVLTRVLGKK